MGCKGSQVRFLSPRPKIQPSFMGGLIFARLESNLRGKQVRTAGTRQTSVCRFASANVPRSASANPVTPTTIKKAVFNRIFYCACGFARNRPLIASTISGSTTSTGKQATRSLNANECPTATAYLYTTCARDSCHPDHKFLTAFFIYEYMHIVGVARIR